jgi:NAD-specific glutamate dehydrogenase
MEHEIASLLKAVFLAIDDFEDMVRSCRALGARLRSRAHGAADLASARSFLEWLLDDNYIFMGLVSYRAGRDGKRSRVVLLFRSEDRRIQEFFHVFQIWALFEAYATKRL